MQAKFTIIICENLRYESKSINPTCVSTPPTIFVPAFFTPHLTCAAVVVVVAVVAVVDDVFVVVFVVVTAVIVVTFEKKNIMISSVECRLN